MDNKTFLGQSVLDMSKVRTSIRCFLIHRAFFIYYWKSQLSW